MFRNLPSFHGLAAFEAVARYQSFAKAAEELCVTQGAISHRIKVLEQQFGARFFVRNRSSVTLTAKGTFFLGAVAAPALEAVVCDVGVPTEYAYHAIYQDAACRRAEVVSFIDWLVTSARQSRRAQGAGEHVK